MAYQCEKCGTTYKNKNEAIECENSHGEPVEIVKTSCKFEDMRYGYPGRIIVKMSNGRFVEYFYTKELNDQYAYKSDRKDKE